MKVKAALGETILKVGVGSYKKWQEARNVLDMDLLLYPSPVWAGKKRTGGSWQQGETWNAFCTPFWHCRDVWVSQGLVDTKVVVQLDQTRDHRIIMRRIGRGPAWHSEAGSYTRKYIAKDTLMRSLKQEWSSAVCISMAFPGTKILGIVSAKTVT